MKNAFTDTIGNEAASAGGSAALSPHREGLAAARRYRLPFGKQSWRGHQGAWQGAGTGSSIDFQDHREYAPGDDPRHIHWAAFARTGQLTMKLYRAEVSPMVDVIVDVSESMTFEPAKVARMEALLAFCAASADAAGAPARVHAARGREVRAVPVESVRAGIFFGNTLATGGARVFNANGVVSSSPRLPESARATLGFDEQKSPTPTGLRPLAMTNVVRPQPRWGWKLLSSLTQGRLLRRQPWAGGRNAVGVELAHASPPTNTGEMNDVAADRKMGLGLGALPWRAGALKVLVSDLLFADEPGPLMSAMSGGDGAAVVFAPALASEAEAPGRGNVELVDCESGERRRQRIDDGLAERYRAAYARHFELWGEAARRCGVTLARVPCEGALAAALGGEALARGAVEARVR